MELPAFFDPIDFKKFTDGKTIVKVSFAPHQCATIETSRVQ